MSRILRRLDYRPITQRLQQIHRCKSMTAPVQKTISWFEADQVFCTPDFKSKADVTKFIRNNKIFENEHIISYNKPAGVRAFRIIPKKGEKIDESELSIQDILHTIALEAKCDNLEICKAPHPSYSGVTIFGKTEGACEEVENIFKHARHGNEYLRTDIALTIGVPSPPSGAITVVFERDLVHGRLTLVPVFKPSGKKLKQGALRRCRTLYRVLDTVNEIALVELRPREGVGEQSLFHMSTKMCKVLGDKKFSNSIVSINGVRMLVEPSSVTQGKQNLSWQMRKKLLIGSDEELDRMPLYMHRSKITLPPNDKLSLPDGLQICAPLPVYYLTTMQLLGLKLPEAKPDET